MGLTLTWSVRCVASRWDTDVPRRRFVICLQRSSRTGRKLAASTEDQIGCSQIHCRDSARNAQDGHRAEFCGKKCRNWSPVADIDERNSQSMALYHNSHSSWTRAAVATAAVHRSPQCSAIKIGMYFYGSQWLGSNLINNSRIPKLPKSTEWNSERHASPSTINRTKECRLNQHVTCLLIGGMRILDSIPLGSNSRNAFTGSNISHHSEMVRTTLGQTADCCSVWPYYASSTLR